MQGHEGVIGTATGAGKAKCAEDEARE